MTKACFWKRLAAMLCLVMTLAAVLCLPLSADMAEEAAGRIYDPTDMLTEAEKASLEQTLSELSAEGVQLYMATYVAENYYDDFIGDEYCRLVRNLKKENAVLLIVTYDLSDGWHYYDMYTYGDANSKISQKEVDYVLDHGDVFNYLKTGHLAHGAKAFFELSQKAYLGRVGAPWSAVITVSALISLVIAGAICGAVVAAYHKKKESVDYPLDRYANLSLSKQNDRFVREYVTRTYVPRSSGGSGGGSRHGGGGGHRGGR